MKKAVRILLQGGGAASKEVSVLTRGNSVFLGKPQDKIIVSGQLGVACRKEEQPAAKAAFHPRDRGAMPMTVVRLEFHSLTRVRQKQFAQARSVRLIALMENDRRGPQGLRLKDLHRATLYGFLLCWFLRDGRKEKGGN